MKWGWAVVVAGVLAFGGIARADEREESRTHFTRGAEYVKKSQWAEALTEFEQADKLHPHSVTTFNIGACQRAMGQYTRARQTFSRALAQNQAANNAELPESLANDTKTFVAEIDKLLATVTITLDPPTAGVTFDGRPLEPESGTILIAGIRAAGSGTAPPAPTFSVRADPGAHVITFTRKGYSDAVVNKTFGPGSQTTLPVKLDNLPATFHIASTPSGAVVTVADADVGLTPVDVLRPAGAYHVVVKKSGFITYDTQVTARAGEDLNLTPTMPVEKKSIAQRWWFWTGIGVLVVGAVVGTALGVYAAQTPQRPPLNGGGLGWTVPVN
jgi:hypothetical protein